MQHRFTTERCRAMGTEFRITVAHADTALASQAIRAAMDQLATLESRLSRYVASSDIARLNHTQRNGSLIVDICTYDCLRIALQVERATDGAFNVAYASTPRVFCSQAIELDARRPTVRVCADGVRLDLGGIGKGFALDQMGHTLRQWDVPRALLAASASTMLALDSPNTTCRGWPMHLGHGRDRADLSVCHAAVSGTGISVKGRHVIDSTTGLPAVRHSQVWAQAPTGAWADALSTAFFIMKNEQIGLFCQRHPAVMAWAESADGRPVRIPAATAAN